jgi:hypothetical protein
VAVVLQSGSAAFTLLGLVFAVSINIRTITMADKQGDLARFAYETLTSFLMVLIIALIFVIPEQGPYGMGIPLLIIGLLRMWSAAKLWKRFHFEGKGLRFLDNALFQRGLLIPNSICHLTLIVTSISLLYRSTNYLGWMTMVIIWLLIVGSMDAWALMLRLAVSGRCGSLRLRAVGSASEMEKGDPTPASPCYGLVLY